MDEQEILNKLEKCAKECDLISKKEKLTPKTKLWEDLGADSLDKYEFGYRVENYFGIAISEKRIATLESINDYIQYIQEHSS